VYPEEFSDEDWEHLGEYFDYPEFEGDFSWDFPEEDGAIDIETYGYPATDMGPWVYPEEFSDEDWEHLGEYFDYPEFEGDFSWDFPEEEWFDYEYEGPRVDEHWTPEGEDDEEDHEEETEEGIALAKKHKFRKKL